MYLNLNLLANSGKKEERGFGFQEQQTKGN